MLWQPVPSQAPATLSPCHWQWFTYPGSLTERLQRQLGNAIEFRLIRAAWDSVSDEERAILSLTSAQHWVREIEWRFCGELWIAARCVIPNNCSNPHRDALIKFGQTSIGNYLFHAADFKPGAFEIAQLPLSHPYIALLGHAALASIPYYWARRRIFHTDLDAVLVSEVFSPAFFAYDFNHD